MEQIFMQYLDTVGVQAAVLLGLAFAATISGIIAAIKAKTFEWRRVGDFLGTIVLPKIGGWLVVASLAYFVDPALVPEGGDLTSDFLAVAAAGAYVAAFASIGGQVLANLAELGVAPTAAFGRK